MRQRTKDAAAARTWRHDSKGPGAAVAWQALQRTIWRAHKARIDAATGPKTPSFVAYEKTYSRAVARATGTSSWPALLAQARRSRIIYIGDYHTLREAKRPVAQLLALLAGKQPLALALEYFPSSQQALLDAYSAGSLSLAKLRVACGRDRPEGVGEASWDSFVPMLSAARLLGVRLLGLDSRGRGPQRLHGRDAHAAKRLAQALRQNPKLQVLVFVGQMHAAPRHLPQAVQTAFGPNKLPATIVYQNCDALYFQQLKRGNGPLKHCVLRLGPQAFALMHTPPTLCQQSFLGQLAAEEDGSNGDAIDAARDTFVQQVRRVAAFLRLPVPPQLADVRIETMGDLSFLRSLTSAGLSAADTAFFREQVKRGNSTFFPQRNLVYLGNLGLAHIAEEASHYLRHSLVPMEMPHSSVDVFYMRALEEALGFFGSKIIHPRRPCPSPVLLRHWAKDGPPAQKKLARTALAHLALEAGCAPTEQVQLYPDDFATLNAVSHILGYRLGEALFCALLRRAVDTAAMRQLFAHNLTPPGAATRAYWTLAAALRPYLPKQAAVASPR